MLHNFGSRLRTPVRGGPGEVTWWVIPCVSNIPTNYSWSFRMCRLLARFSKYDFWNPGEILNWHRWKYFSKIYFFKTKKNLGKKWKLISDFFLTKNENFEKSKFWEFRNFGRFSKFWNFEIPKISIFQNFHFFCQKKIWKYFHFFLRKKFGLEKNIFSKNIFTYINSKFPQDSKNRT